MIQIKIELEFIIKIIIHLTSIYIYILLINIIVQSISFSSINFSQETHKINSIIMRQN